MSLEKAEIDSKENMEATLQGKQYQRLLDRVRTFVTIITNINDFSLAHIKAADMAEEMQQDSIEIGIFYSLILSRNIHAPMTCSGLEPTGAFENGHRQEIIKKESNENDYHSWARLLTVKFLIYSQRSYEQLDDRKGPTWHCIVGRNFGSFVTHESKHFIYFYLGHCAILLFKTQ
ncbi:Dynein light chain, cytoplasmic [Golovinomyces cichoracearum]|uniref:Dynein light chain n=1 Tax=Golovinomyces cichoracearum TaxID=62708 RepID=A0A420IQD1_9PEZI|nr:Dynein light chain, cytoplasmic [Golovinomyces cichoracearum]